MRWVGSKATRTVLALGFTGLTATATMAAKTLPSKGPIIHISDVSRFYKVYDAAHGHPTAEQLQREYLDPGSAGLHHLARIVASPAKTSQRRSQSIRGCTFKHGAVWRFCPGFAVRWQGRCADWGVFIPEPYSRRLPSRSAMASLLVLLIPPAS